MDVVALKADMPLPGYNKINSNILETVVIIIDAKSKTRKPNKETAYGYWESVWLKEPWVMC